MTGAASVGATTLGVGDTKTDGVAGVGETDVAGTGGTGGLIDGVFETGTLSVGSVDTIGVVDKAGVSGVVPFGSLGMAASAATGGKSTGPASEGAATGAGLAGGVALGWALTPVAKQRSAANVTTCKKVSDKGWGIRKNKLEWEALTGALTLRAGERDATKSLYFR
jgi:hypothetical protein